MRLLESVDELVWYGGEIDRAAAICALLRVELVATLEGMAAELDDTTAVWSGNEPAAIRRAAAAVRERLS